MPSRSFDSTPRRAMRCFIPRWLQASRHLRKSYPLSACSFSGRRRGLPRRPFRTAGIASINVSKTLESCWFAGPIRAASGIPRRSTIRWCLLPARPRSVGFGPVSEPPFLPEGSRHPAKHATSPVSLPPATRPTATGGRDPRPQARASASTVASRSSRCRSPSPVAGTPTGCPSSTRTGCPGARLDPAHAAFPSVIADPSPRSQARSSSTAQMAKSLGPSLYILHLQVFVQDGFVRHSYSVLGSSVFFQSTGFSGAAVIAPQARSSTA